MARILVIECDPDIRTMLILLLQRAGHTVRGASNGARGVELIYEMKPDLIITELQLPVLNGWGVIQYMRHRPQIHSIPVIAMTTHLTDPIQVSTRSSSFNALFLKPFNLTDFMDGVTALLRQSAPPSRPNAITC